MVGKDVMEDKDYKAWLDESKSELDAYSASREEIDKLYGQAIADAEAAHAEDKQRLEKESFRKKNNAATDNMRAGRNLKQSLASRGLAFSGENAQTDVDLTLALQNRMGEIDSETLAQAQTLERKHGETVADLKRDRAQHRSEVSLTLAKLKAELAKAEQNKAQQDSDPSAGTASSAPVGVPGSLTENAASMLGQMQNKIKDVIKEQTITPSITPKELAKQLIKAAGGSGSISGFGQQQAMETLLETLNGTYLLDGDYRKQLMLNLQSMGYNPQYKTAYTEEIKTLKVDAVKTFDLYYDRYFDIYYYAGYSVNESDSMAYEMAQFLQLAYMYRHSYTKEMFEIAVREMGYGSKLKSFYEEIAKEPDSYVLGSEAKEPEA